MFAYRLEWESAHAKTDIVTAKYIWKLILGVDKTHRKETVYYNSGIFSKCNFFDFFCSRTPPRWRITLILCKSLILSLWKISEWENIKGPQSLKLSGYYAGLPGPHFRVWHLDQSAVFIICSLWLIADSYIHFCL